MHNAAIAVATWLDGWMSLAGIVSKQLNLSWNFFDQLVAPSFRFFLTRVPIHLQGEPRQQGRKIHGVGKSTIFGLNRLFISETVPDRPMVTMEL